jgi:hypothetical protein
VHGSFSCFASEKMKNPPVPFGVIYASSVVCKLFVIPRVLSHSFISNLKPFMVDIPRRILSDGEARVWR